MAVSVDIPGIGPVIASNAAENSTLQAILEATNRMAQRVGAQRVELGNFQRNANRAASALGDIANAVDDAADSTEDLAARQKRAAAEFSRSMRTAGSQFRGMFKSGGDFAGSITSAGTGISTLLTGAGDGVASIIATFGGRLGPLGKSLSKVAEYGGAAAGALVGLATGEIAKVVGGFESLINSGGSFGYSMDQFALAASESGLSVAQFGRMVKEAAPSLAVFGGNTLDGGRALTRLTRNLIVENRNLSQSMRLMGVSYEAQGVMLADYAANLAKSGVAIENIDPSEVTRGFFELTKQQRMFAQYNGITLDQQRELQKQARENVSVEAVIQSQGLIGQAAEEFRAKYAQITQQYGDAAGQLFLQQREFGGAVTETAAAVEMMNPQLANMTKAAGATGADLATIQRTMLDPETQRRATREMGQLAVLGVAGVNDSIVSAAGEMMMRLRDDLPRQISDVMGRIGNELERMTEDIRTNSTANIGQLSQAFVDLTTVAQSLRIAMSETTVSFLQSSGFQAFAGALEVIAEKITEVLGPSQPTPAPIPRVPRTSEQALEGQRLQSEEALKDYERRRRQVEDLRRRNRDGSIPITPRPGPETLTPEERSRSFPITPRPVNPRPRPDADTISSILPIMNQQQVDGFEEAGQAASRANPQLASLIDRINSRDQEAMDKQRELIDSQTKTNDAINQSNQQMANLSNILREGLRTMNTTLDDIATNTA